MLRTVTFVCLTGVLLACGGAEAQRPAPIDGSSRRESFEALRAELTTRTEAGTFFEDFPAQQTLGRLHTQFGKPGFLERQRIGGYVVLDVPQVPEEMRRSILAASFPAELPTGYDLLERAFWEALFQAQDAGQGVAFIERPEGSRSVAAINFLERGTIALALFASAGTFAHELRHTEQWQQMQAIHATAPTSLSPTCISTVGTLFGEMDATYVQLQNWRSFFATVDFTPSWQAEAVTFEPERLPKFHELFAMQTFLQYPTTVLLALKLEAECPAELLSFADAAAGAFRALETTVGEKAKRLRAINASYYKNSVLLNSQCGGDAEHCTELRARQEQLLAEAPVLKADIQSLLQGDAEAAWSGFRTQANQLPIPMQKELCSRALGFVGSTDCENHL